MDEKSPGHEGRKVLDFVITPPTVTPFLTFRFWDSWHPSQVGTPDGPISSTLNRPSPL